jgi:hypothetical protein
MVQPRISNLAILSIERDIATKVNFDDLIKDFAACKARKVKLT